MLIFGAKPNWKLNGELNTHIPEDTGVLDMPSPGSVEQEALELIRSEEQEIELQDLERFALVALLRDLGA